MHSQHLASGKKHFQTKQTVVILITPNSLNNKQKGKKSIYVELYETAIQLTLTYKDGSFIQFSLIILLEKTISSVQYMYMLSHFNRIQLFVTPSSLAYQAPLSMGFSWQEYWSQMPFPSPGDLPDPGIEPGSPALEADALTSEPPGKPIYICVCIYIYAGDGMKDQHCRVV